MVDNTYSNKLNEVIKRELTNYETSGNTPDWARMEGMLGAVPKSNSYNFKDKFQTLSESLKTKSKTISLKQIRPLYIVIVLLVLAISAGVYWFVNSPKASDTISIKPDKMADSLALEAQKKSMAKDSSAQNSSGSNTNTQQLIDTINNTIPEEEVEDKIASDTDEVVDNNKDGDKDKNKNEKSDNKKKDSKKDADSQNQLSKNSQSDFVFPNDSIKGIIEKLKENKNQRDSVAHNANLKKTNTDTIKKLQNAPVKDSIH